MRCCGPGGFVSGSRLCSFEGKGGRDDQSTPNVQKRLTFAIGPNQTKPNHLKGLHGTVYRTVYRGPPTHANVRLRVLVDSVIKSPGTGVRGGPRGARQLLHTAGCKASPGDPSVPEAEGRTPDCIHKDRQWAWGRAIACFGPKGVKDRAAWKF